MATVGNRAAPPGALPADGRHACRRHGPPILEELFPDILAEPRDARRRAPARTAVTSAITAEDTSSGPVSRRIPGHAPRPPRPDFGG